MPKEIRRSASEIRPENPPGPGVIALSNPLNATLRDSVHDAACRLTRFLGVNPRGCETGMCRQWG